MGKDSQRNLPFVPEQLELFGDDMVIESPKTGEERYLITDKNEVIDMRLPHTHVFDTEDVDEKCKVCGKMFSVILEELAINKEGDESHGE